MPRVVKATIYNQCAFSDCRYEWRPRRPGTESPYCPKCMRRGWEDGVIPPKIPKQFPAPSYRQLHAADRYQPTITEGQQVLREAREKAVKPIP